MKGWKECKLGEVIYSNGSSITASYSHKTIKYLDTGSITCGKIDSFQEILLSEAPSRAKRLVKDGSIVYSTVRPIQRHYGYIKNPPENLVVSTGFSVIETQPDLADSLFIYHLLASKDVVELLDTIAEGSTSAYPSLKPTDIENLDILLPPLPEQRAIASVLSSLDDKIDLLHRQNKTLEAMAETLFRQWFVEEADEGWEEGTITDLINFNPNRKLSKGTLAPYLEMAALSTTGFMPTGWYSREFSSGMKFMNGDTLIARITPCLENGKTAFITFLEENQIGWGSTEYIVMRPKEYIHPLFAYALARTQDFRDYAEGCLEGTSGRQRVNIDHLMAYPFSIPDRQTVNNYNNMLKSIEPKLIRNAIQIRTLEKIRDTLLPKLMSGEVRVKV
jgi:type I restriction enzyme, S subunit